MNVRFVAAEGDPAWKIAGLSVAERTLRALDVAGVDAAKVGEGPRLVLARDALLEPAAVRALSEAGANGQVVVPEGDAQAAAALWPAELALPDDAADLQARLVGLRQEGRVREVPLDGARCERVRTHGDATRTERAMLASLVQPTDGFFARHFDRQLSIPLSLWFLRLGVAPNTITVVATLVGLYGAWLLASTQIPVQVLGALLFIASTILDGSDGEVARLGLRQSEFGGRLDLIGDNVVNGAVFIGIGWSALALDPSAAMKAAVIAALVGVAAASAAGFGYANWLDRSGRDASALHAYESLASRDWAYLVLALALFGKTAWLIWAAAVGSNLAALGLVALRLRGWPPADGAD